MARHVIGLRKKLCAKGVEQASEASVVNVVVYVTPDFCGIKSLEGDPLIAALISDKICSAEEFLVLRQVPSKNTDAQSRRFGLKRRQD